MINEVPQKGLLRDRQPAGRIGQETSVGHPLQVRQAGVPSTQRVRFVVGTAEI